MSRVKEQAKQKTIVKQIAREQILLIQKCKECNYKRNIFYYSTHSYLYIVYAFLHME
jgi:hypothetical protein